MPLLRTLIVDDEPQARAGLRALLGRDPEVEAVGEASHGDEALELIGRLVPDLVLLDIQMPGKNGFDVLEAVDPAHSPIFVFITAFDEYTLRAFEVHALDYLLKPFTDERFFEAMEHAKKRHRQLRSAGLGQELAALLEERRRHRAEEDSAALKRFAVKKGDETFYVDARQVKWIEAEEYCVRLHVDDGRGHLLRGHLGSFERRLDPHRFLRVHRSALVNLEHVASLRALFHGQVAVVLSDGTEVRVSRGRRAELESRLESWG